MRKQGIIKYDSKHDSFFIQSGNEVFTLFLFEIAERLLGETVKFTCTSVNEVLAFEVSK